jgi:hypothetical protein
MRRFRSRQLILLAAVALSTWTCSTTSTTPTTNNTAATTLPPTTTEVFSSPLTPNGAVTFPFNTSTSGLITVTLTAINPDNTLSLGMAIGILSGTTCELKVTNDTAPQGTIVTAVAGAASSFCARVSDAAGVLAAPISVSVTIVHF